MAIARQRDRLKGGQPKLKPAQEPHLVKLYDAGEHTITDLADLFGVSRATVFRAVQRQRRRES